MAWVQNFSFLVSRDLGVFERETMLEVLTPSNRPFLIFVPEGTRYGDIIRWKAGPRDVDIRNTIIEKGQ